MRYLMMTTFSCVSMWMSEARRWIALKTIESTSLMIGEASCVIRSIVRVSSPSSSSETSCIRKSSVASSRTRWEDSLFWRMSPIARAAADLEPRAAGPTSSSSSSSRTTSVGSAQMIVSDPLGPASPGRSCSGASTRPGSSGRGRRRRGRTRGPRTAAPAARRGRCACASSSAREENRTCPRRIQLLGHGHGLPPHDLIADMSRNIGR